MMRLDELRRYMIERERETPKQTGSPETKLRNKVIGDAVKEYLKKVKKSKRAAINKHLYDKFSKIFDGIDDKKKYNYVTYALMNNTDFIYSQATHHWFLSENEEEDF